MVTAWLKANADCIELFYLPPYAPEHNPNGFLNNDVKQVMARRPMPRDKAAMRRDLSSPLICTACSGVPASCVHSSRPHRSATQLECMIRI